MTVRKNDVLSRHYEEQDDWSCDVVISRESDGDSVEIATALKKPWQ